MRILECIEKNGNGNYLLYKTKKVSLDINDNDTINYDYKSVSKSLKGDFAETDKRRVKTVQIPMDLILHVSPIFSYFLDGSRHIYKVDDISIGGKIFPFMAGQIIVGCCERRNRDDFKKADLFRSIVLAYKFGILSGEHRTREEVANVYQLTTERVRQLIQNYKLDSSMAFTALEDWEYYSDTAPTVLTKQSSFYNETAQAENITEGYDAFVGLLSTIISYRKIRRNNEKIFIKAEYEKKARLILDLLTDVLQEKYTRDTTIQLTQVVGQQAISMEIAKIFLSEVFKVEIHPGDTIEVKQGKIDVSKEIVEVLETFGHAMSLDDIYMFFKDKYPDHKYEEAAQLRPSIINSDEIVAIGKSGQYALKKWNTFTGCIKDCAYMILQEATEPMQDAELVEKVLEYFPNSSFRSIMSTLVADPQERFTHYTDSSTWLVEKDHLTNKIKVRSRISSEDRFEDLKAFIATYKRWPFASGGDEEASLSRWIYNHSRRDLLPGYDPKEAKQIETLQEEYAHLPHNNSEYEFLNTCSDFKIFLQNNYRLPDENSSDESELELAIWFRKTSTKREPYDDNRRLYFNELLRALEDYGFYFQ